MWGPIFLSLVMAMVATEGLAHPCAKILQRSFFSLTPTAQAVLLTAIDDPDRTTALIFAETLEDMGTGPLLAQAHAIRLAVDIEAEGGSDNPFAETVDSAGEQLARLEKHPRGPVLIELWNEARWRVLPALRAYADVGIIFRAGLPRKLEVRWYRQLSKFPWREFAVFGARFPSVNGIIVRQRNETLYGGETAGYLAALGHPGITAGLKEMAQRKPHQNLFLLDDLLTAQPSPIHPQAIDSIAPPDSPNRALARFGDLVRGDSARISDFAQPIALHRQWLPGRAREFLQRKLDALVAPMTDREKHRLLETMELPPHASLADAVQRGQVQRLERLLFGF